MKYIVAIGILVGLLGMYIVLLLLNKKTPVPEGCENLTAECHACGIMDCPVRKETNHSTERSNHA